MLNNLCFGELTNDQLNLWRETRNFRSTVHFADGAAVGIYPSPRLVDEYNQRIPITSQDVRIYTIECMVESREAATYGRRPSINVRRNI